MRRFLPVLILIPLLLSMSEPASVPPEMKNLRAKVVDRKGVEHQLRGLVCNQGGTVKFKKGTVDYTLSLSSIRMIEVLGEEEGSVRVRVKLKDGEEEVFNLPSSTRCTADSDVGSVSFYINEIKSIELSQGEER